MTAFYNEIEPYAAKWLGNLAAANQIAPGIVDARCIKEISGVGGAMQAHFFAGIGVWSYALRLAGWPDDAPVWTGSCPCQPFSAAGRKKGTADVRHLWPDWFKLIDSHRPAIVFGEQVASPDGLGWLDNVQTDLERADYTFRAVDLCAAGVGAPHIRQRLYFVAVANGERLERLRLHLRQRRSQPAVSEAARRAAPSSLADVCSSGPQVGGIESAREELQAAKRGSSFSGLANAAVGVGQQGCEVDGRRDPGGAAVEGSGSGSGGVSGVAQGDACGEGGGRVAGAVPRAEAEGQGCGERARHLADESLAPGPTNGFWRDADWLPCRDGKWRPVEPGSFPLAHGAPARVGRTRAYGNAIVPQVAATFVRAVMEALCDG